MRSWIAATLRAKHAALSPVLTERSRRVWAATEAQAIGYGGIAQVARATGIAASTIQRGLRDLASGEPLAGTRTRRPGGGRKRATDLDATLLRDLDALVEPTAPGDPDSPLRWTCLSARTLAVALDGLGHHVSHTVVAELLHGLGYSLQGNVKTREGRQHVDRDAQFRYIARRVRAAQRQQQPTISVDTKKKELIGDFKNAGRTWRPVKSPHRVRVHDFLIPATPTRREGHSVRRLRPAPQRRLGERGHRSRHRDLCGAVDPALVAAHGPPGVSRGPVAR